MKLILSRKGFDTTAGGGPSPILTDGRMVSLPIPEPRPDGATGYADLVHADGGTYLDLLGSLGYTRFGPASRAHLDPDLVPTVRHRHRSWRGTFGQVDAAAAHLRNQGVGPGDLFLFWGLYAEVPVRGPLPSQPLRSQPRRHALFGYLEVDSVVDAGAGGTVPGATDHPHLAPSYRGRTNLVYLATGHLSHQRSLPGWGVFHWSPELDLTPSGASDLTTWRLPGCFHPEAGTVLTYHRDRRLWGEPDRGDGVTVVRRGQGQEFVCEATPDVLAWALGVIRRGTRGGAPRRDRVAAERSPAPNAHPGPL